MADSPLVVADRLSRLRHDLLRVCTRAEAIHTGVDAVREILALEEGARVVYESRRAAPQVGQAPTQGCHLPLRSTAGNDHGDLVIVGDDGRLSFEDSHLRAVANDLAQALDNVDRAVGAREVERLRGELARRDALVRQAGDALIRDAHELVRVLAELEGRDARLNADLQQALRFQKAMIAPLPTVERTSMSAIGLAAEMISGDFYDVAALGPEWIRVFVADATGHGVAAGLATMFIKSEYEAQKRFLQSPAAILRAMNEQLASSYRNLELQFTALCMDIHLDAGLVSYASAAHPGPIMVRASVASPLPSGGPFVGVTTGVDFPEHDVAVRDGDLFVLFSDGLLDAESASGASFGQAGVVEGLRGVNGVGAEACPALVRALASFVGEGRGLGDDVTIVALSLGP